MALAVVLAPVFVAALVYALVAGVLWLIRHTNPFTGEFQR